MGRKEDLMNKRKVGNFRLVRELYLGMTVPAAVEEV